MREAEGVVVPADQERRRAQVLLPQIRDAGRVVQFQVRPAVEELQQPLLHVAHPPRGAAGAPQLGGQVLHEQFLVLGQQAVLAVVPFQPLADERGVQVDRADGAAGEFGLLERLQLLGDHPQGQRPLGDLSQVVHAVDQLQQPLDVGAGQVGRQVGAHLLLVEGQHEQGQVVGGGRAVPVLPGEVRGLVPDRAEVVGPAGQQQLARPGRRPLGRAGVPGVLGGTPERAGEHLAGVRVQVHQHLVQTRRRSARSHRRRPDPAPARPTGRRRDRPVPAAPSGSPAGPPRRAPRRGAGRAGRTGSAAAPTGRGRAGPTAPG